MADDLAQRGPRDRADRRVHVLERVRLLHRPHRHRHAGQQQLRGGPAVQLRQVALGTAAAGAFEHFGSAHDVPGRTYGLPPFTS